MTEQSQTARPLDEIILPEGTMIKVGGVPFFLSADTAVFGIKENVQFALAPMPTGGTGGEK